MTGQGLDPKTWLLTKAELHRELGVPSPIYLGRIFKWVVTTVLVTVASILEPCVVLSFHVVIGLSAW